MAAIWARWVTQRTWHRRERRLIFSATFPAARPLTPVSTSSKIRVMMLSFSARTFFRASMMRLSSPPEATLAMGLRFSPTLADMRNRTSSIPVSSRPRALVLGANSVSKRTFGISSSRSSPSIRAFRASAAAFRFSDRPTASSFT